MKSLEVLVVAVVVVKAAVMVVLIAVLAAAWSSTAATHVLILSSSHGIFRGRPRSRPKSSRCQIHIARMVVDIVVVGE